jgi:Uma2 family endonuclease
MRTVVLGERPTELEALIARRRALGQDRYDEVWDGEYHMSPAAHLWHGIVINELGAVLRQLAAPLGLVVGVEFNLGYDDHNFRVPDLGVHRSPRDEVWVPTAAMVVEVVSPDDESWLKFDHYAAHGVDEVLIADPQDRTLHLFALVDGRYQPTDRSELLDVSVAELHQAIAWPGSQ